MKLSTNPKSVYHREWQRKNWERAKLHKYNDRHKIVLIEGVQVTKGRLRHVKKHFDLTAEQYVALYKQNDGKCHLCDKELDMLKKQTVHVDHCHETGKVRGMLCAPCNTLIGRVENLGEKITNYLQKLTNKKRKCI